MVRTYKYRIYPTKAQVRTLEAHLAVCCELYNAAIQERRDAWRLCRKSISCFQQDKQLLEIRRDREDVGAVAFNVLAVILQRVNLAFQAFHRRLKNGDRAGFPRFRSVARFDSLPFRNRAFSLRGRTLHLSRIGDIKLKLHRPVDGEIRTAVVKREAGKWYACITLQVQPAPLQSSVEHVGIDVGLEYFASLSNGAQAPNHRYARQAASRMRRAHRRIARRRRGSMARREAVRLLQVAQAHVRNQRSDQHHKLSRALVNRYGLISIEDLNVKGMARGHFAKSIHDAGWSLFTEKLAYKAESAGRVLVKVDPRGTSQHCLCGARVPKSLSTRWHDCPECGLSAPRDVVSAQLIDRLGLSRQDGTWAAGAERVLRIPGDTGRSFSGVEAS